MLLALFMVATAVSAQSSFLRQMAKADTGMQHKKLLGADATPVEKYGQLQVKGNKIRDAADTQDVTLKGVSLFWSQWISKYWNPETVNWLIDDWGVDVIRCPVAGSDGGFDSNPDQEYAKFQTVANACRDRGIYVIADWHIEGNKLNEGAATDFFTRVMNDFGDYPGLMFEPFNEPINEINWANPDYYERIINHIRGRGSDQIVILGSNQWSSDLRGVADNAGRLRQAPFDHNVAYTLHFYAASHFQDHRDSGQAALDQNFALFITEWGTCEASGNGRVDENSAAEWTNWATSRGISMTNWGVYDKNESCAALRENTGNSGWGAGQLTQSGNWVRAFISGNAPPPPVPPGPGPGNGCCAWEPYTECGQSSDYCMANADQCAVCQGRWIGGGGGGGSTGCCKWAPYTECGQSSDYCMANAENCAVCEGQWS